MTSALALVDSAPIFAALGDQTRLALLSRLCLSGPESIARLTAGTEVSRQAITRHLQVLAEAGLVRDIRRGRERIWEADPRRIDEACDCLEEISKSWDRQLARLQKFVER